MRGPGHVQSILPRHYVLDVVSPQEVCEDCHTVVRKYRIVTHKPVGIMLGEPLVRHHIKQCSQCGRTYRCAEFDALKPRQSTYAFDSIVAVGKARFLQHQQNQEIAAEFAQRFGLTIPLSTIQDLARKFLEYCAAIQAACSPQIKEHLADQGGYILHLDGTCEAGTDQLFVALDARTGWLLDSCKMKTENEADIARFLTTLITRFGKPLAIVTDLSPHIAQAITTVVPDIPHFICHYHFLVTVGEKLLTKQHTLVLKHIRQAKIQVHLKNLRCDLQRYAQGGKNFTPFDRNSFGANPQQILTLSPEQAQRYITYAMLQWLKDYKSDLKGEYFPFDLPSLAFYRRGVKLVRIIDTLVSRYQLKNHQWQSLKTIQAHLSKLLQTQDLMKAAQRLEKAETLFLKLRQVLRLADRKNKPVLRQNATAAASDFSSLTEELTTFAQSLRKKIQNDPDKDRREDAQIVTNYLDKYWHNLLDPVLLLPGWTKPILVNRTNNIAERFFAAKKRTLRRKGGNKILAKNIQAMQPEELIAENLRNPTYVEFVYGKLENLAEIFAHYQHQVSLARQQKQIESPTRPFLINNKILRKNDILDKIVLCSDLIMQTNYDSISV